MTFDVSVVTDSLSKHCSKLLEQSTFYFSFHSQNETELPLKPGSSTTLLAWLSPNAMNDVDADKCRCLALRRGHERLLGPSRMRPRALCFASETFFVVV